MEGRNSCPPRWAWCKIPLLLGNDEPCFGSCAVPSSVTEMLRRGPERRTALATTLLALSCSARTVAPDGQAGGAGPAPGGGTGGLIIDPVPTGRCSDRSLLKCRKVDCPADSVPSTTSVSGHVYDPAGKVPLYNAVVYVAEPGELVDLKDRAQCEDCAAHFPKTATAVALTGSDGSFRLTDVPVGKDIPLTVQVGKWRRTVPVEVAPCTNTLLSPELTRLPRNSREGHLPKIAVTTGGSDALECLLYRIGVDAEEFTPEGNGGRVSLWAGFNAATTMLEDGRSVPLPPARELWADADRMLGYDMILMGCEGNDNLWNQPPDALPDGVSERRTPEMHLEVRKYADLGGRIFGSHWHHRWINSGDTTPDNAYPKVAAFSETAADVGSVTVQVDTSFPKGIAFRDWLVQVGASTTAGQLPLVKAEHSVDTVDDTLAQRWIFGEDGGGKENGDRARDMVQYFSFTTPVGQAECGRMVFSDVHVTFGGADLARQPFPARCNVRSNEELSPQEKALQFMIFDLSSCIQKEDDEVSIPIPPVK